MKIISPDEFLEGFVALLIFVLCLGVAIQVLTGTEMIDLVSGLIELLLPLFLAGFILVLAVNVVKEIID